MNRIAAVQAAMERSARTGITADEVVRELALIAFLGIREVLDPTGRVRPLNKIPVAAGRAIRPMKTRRYSEGDGDDAREVDFVEF